MRVILLLLLLAAVPLSGCAVAALPCRLTSDVVDVVPVAGGAASAPFSACASAID
jgi:hypothetical protein